MIEMRFKKGDTRTDGFRFWQYRKRNGKIQECWINPIAFEKFKNESNRISSEWSKKNREKIKPLDAARKRNSRKNNPDHYRALQKKSYYKNRNKNLELKRRLYKENKEIYIKKSLEWQYKNPQKAHARNSKRRAIKLNATSIGHDIKIENCLYNQCKSLYRRIGIKFEVDHIIPLSKGGMHHHLNLHVIPASLNRVKHSKDISCIPNCWNPVVRSKIPLTI